MAEDFSLATLGGYFADEDAAYARVESIRWPDGPVCPHCGVVNDAYLLQPKNGPRKTSTGKDTFRRVWKCGACRQQFSVLVGTIFEDSKLPLSKWLYAIHMLCAAKNGIAANELRRTLDITYKSAWFMLHRIRYAMEQEPLRSKLTGTVEVDETYIGGKSQNMHAKKRRERITGTGGIDKTAVVSLVQRGGEVRSQVVQGTVSGKTLAPIIREHVAHEARLMTDSFGGYTRVGKEFAEHQTVNHLQGEYVRGDAYTNLAEGYFSQLKRSIDGTHHHVSAHHLGRYVAEFDYRYNTRKQSDAERTTQAIRKTTGKRLRYRATE
jgi:transposase-like protein